MQLSFKLLLADYTLFEMFNFCTKIQLLFLEQIVDFFGWKTHENVVVLDFLAVDNFDFTRKIVDFYFGWKTHENVVVPDFLPIDNFDFTRKKKIGEKLAKLNFWTKIWLFE